MRHVLLGLVACSTPGCASLPGDRAIAARAHDAVGVVVHISVAPEQASEFAELAQRTMIEPTQSAAGCLRYELWHDVEDPGRFAIIEEWESQEAHSAHLAEEWLHEVGAALQPFATEPFSMQRLRRAR